MNKVLTGFSPEKEASKIVYFIKKTFTGQGIKTAIVGVSGGIDSATSLSLTIKALGAENVIAIHMPYLDNHEEDFRLIIKNAGVLPKNSRIISVKKMTDAVAINLGITGIKTQTDKIRFGNITARMRMITLYDCAKKNESMVVGTENKTENLLSYFTRFGDEASDIEPIQHLYKTQVYALSKFLRIPQKIIDKTPTAGLWQGQTDEEEFGFSYNEADNVLYLYFDKNMTLKEIENLGYKNTRKVIKHVRQNEYKHKVPYKL